MTSFLGAPQGLGIVPPGLPQAVMPRCQTWTMTWVMTDPAETPDKYLGVDLFGQPTGVSYNEVQDLATDPTGATWNINGYYAGTDPNYSLESTAQFQITAFQLTGTTATAGACASYVIENNPIVQAPSGAVPCSSTATSQTATSGMCCPAGQQYDATSNTCLLFSSEPVTGGDLCTVHPELCAVKASPNQPNQPNTTPSNTGTYVLVGLGVLGAGTALYFALR